MQDLMEKLLHSDNWFSKERAGPVRETSALKQPLDRKACDSDCQIVYIAMIE